MSKNVYLIILILYIELLAQLDSLGLLESISKEISRDQAKLLYVFIIHFNYQFFFNKTPSSYSSRSLVTPISIMLFSFIICKCCFIIVLFFSFDLENGLTNGFTATNSDDGK